jgi:hypothetical protein
LIDLQSDSLAEPGAFRRLLRTAVNEAEPVKGEWVSLELVDVPAGVCVDYRLRVDADGKPVGVDVCMASEGEPNG